MLKVVSAAAALLLTGVTIAIAGSEAAKSRGQLTALLGVLRQRQTRADRSPALLDHLRALLPTLQDPGPERLDRSLVRIAGRTPWGSEIVLAGFRTVGDGRASRVPEMLGALVSGEIGRRAPASEIRHFGDVAYFAIRRGAERIVLVVPDGVRSVAYYVSRGPTVKAEVHNNTSAFVICPVPADPGLIVPESTMTWYGPEGSIVKQVPSESSVRKPVIRRHEQWTSPAVNAAR
jgi:hypothetical protein